MEQKKYTINKKIFTLAKATNRRKLKFAKHFGATKISDVPKLFGTTEKENYEKMDALVFDILVDDAKLLNVMQTIFIEPITADDVATIDAPDQIVQMITDFFTESPESLNAQ